MAAAEGRAACNFFQGRLGLEQQAEVTLRVFTCSAWCAALSRAPALHAQRVWTQKGDCLLAGRCRARAGSAQQKGGAAEARRTGPIAPMLASLGLGRALAAVLHQLLERDARLCRRGRLLRRWSGLHPARLFSPVAHQYSVAASQAAVKAVLLAFRSSSTARGVSGTCREAAGRSRAVIRPFRALRLLSAFRRQVATQLHTLKATTAIDSALMPRITCASGVRSLMLGASMVAEQLPVELRLLMSI
jgi:hypothetical protein